MWIKISPVCLYKKLTSNLFILQGRSKLTLTSDKGCKRKYKSFSVDVAVKEAESLLKLKISERIERCVYVKLPSVPSKASTIGKQD
jgi:hypothetical protein